MTTAIVCVFIGIMIAWWAGQGMFSSLIHLVLTILAGCVAFAVWEPLAAGFLLDRMPDYAWGVSLMVPFGLTLLVLRVAFDMLIPGNLHFHNVADKIGGGVFGLCSGVLTAGILVLGLQMTTGSFFGYQGWDAVGKDEPEKVASIFPSVDTITADFFTRLSGGAMSPIGSSATLANTHPDLAAEANLFTQAPFPDTRPTVREANAKVVAETYCIVAQVPTGLEETNVAQRMKAVPQGKLVVVPINISVQSQDAPPGAGDGDGIYRVGREQVALLTSPDNGRTLTAVYPTGYAQRNEYKALGQAGVFAYSPAGVIDVTHEWFFVIPQDHTPLAIRVKNLRLPLPEAAKAQTDATVVAGMVSHKPTEVALDPENGGGNNGEVGSPDGIAGSLAEAVAVSNRLPFTFNRNKLTNVEMNGNALASGKGQIVKPGRGDIPGRNLAVNEIHHAQGARIVQVNMGQRQQGSLLGQVMAFPATVTQPPVLKSESGDTFFAIGWGIVTSGGAYRFDINPQAAVRSMRQVDTGAMGPGDKLILYYQVPVNTHLVAFDLGNAQNQEIDVTVE